MLGKQVFTGLKFLRTVQMRPMVRLREARDATFANNQFVSALWSPNPGGGKQWQQFRENNFEWEAKWEAIQTDGLKKGAKSIIYFWPSNSHAMVTGNGYYTDTKENLDYIKTNMKLRPLSDRVSTFSFYLTLLLPFVALVFCLKRRPKVSLCLVGLSFVFFQIYSESLPVSSIRVDLVMSLPAMGLSFLVGLASLISIFKKWNKGKNKNVPN
jgi:hypothetical protein